MTSASAHVTSLSYAPVLESLGFKADDCAVYSGAWAASGPWYESICPTTGAPILRVRLAADEDYARSRAAAIAAYAVWRKVPAPKRGEVVRQIADALRASRTALGQLIALEMGKIVAEGIGEVQEAIDIADYAVGLSRMLNGKVIPSERPEHIILETYRPLGPVAVITAFNFPCAVWAWNAMIALVCGDAVFWKPATSTSLVAIAMTRIVARVLEANGYPGAVCTLCAGRGASVGSRMLDDPAFELLSFTGSCDVGKTVATRCAQRFARTILELGGNNAMIVMEDADLDLVVPGVLFNAVGTAGQRCTTLRRLILHEDVYDTVLARLRTAYASVRLGDPLDPDVLVGPLHTPAAVREYTDGLARIREQGGTVVCTAPTAVPEACAGGYFVPPVIVAISADAPILNEELFVPILYVVKVSSFAEAVATNNSVPQGLSSALFTRDVQRVFQWLATAEGSDCGLVNVNIPTSGAEIGGAFGGNKATGNGREAGGDSWMQYCRLSTCTVNFGSTLPLAQGIDFGGARTDAGTDGA